MCLYAFGTKKHRTGKIQVLLHGKLSTIVSEVLIWYLISLYNSAIRCGHVPTLHEAHRASRTCWMTHCQLICNYWEKCLVVGRWSFEYQISCSSVKDIQLQNCHTNDFLCLNKNTAGMFQSVGISWLREWEGSQLQGCCHELRASLAVQQLHQPYDRLDIIWQS